MTKLRNPPNQRALPVSKRSRFDAVTAWTVGGSITTFWGVVITIILSFLTPVREWCQSNYQWLIPTLAVFLLISTFILGFVVAVFLGYAAEKNQSISHGLKAMGETPYDLNRVTDLASLWERERRAMTV